MLRLDISFDRLIHTIELLGIFNTQGAPLHPEVSKQGQSSGKRKKHHCRTTSTVAYSLDGLCFPSSMSSSSCLLSYLDCVRTLQRLCMPSVLYATCVSKTATIASKMRFLPHVH
eukprot:3295413-Amphidinium_carterae.1